MVILQLFVLEKVFDGGGAGVELRNDVRFIIRIIALQDTNKQLAACSVGSIVRRQLLDVSYIYYEMSNTEPDARCP